MAPKITRRKILVGVGTVGLLAAAFGAGAWVGADWVGRFYGYQALPRASADANLLHHKLLQLDKDDAKGLREGINMELDGDLHAMCAMADSGFGSSHDITTARTILQRIAKYRAEKPATYPAAYLAQVDEAPSKKLKACLDAALSSPGR
jgi:hypothetical protein